MPFVTDSNPVQYNGYTFPSNVETVGFQALPQADEAHRTILFTRYRITLRWTVSADIGFNIDTTMAALRTTLQQHGKDFTYENRGFGANWSIGPAGDFQCVEGGPWPADFTFRPKGKNQGATCFWTVTVSVPTNCAAIVYTGVPMTFQYRLHTRIDRHGNSTRTYSGFIAVPKIILDDISIADTWLESIIPQIPNQFYRDDRDCQSSYDDKRIDFNVVDIELGDNMLPPYCTGASANHSIQSTDRGLLSWVATISGSYTLPKGNTIAPAWNAFRDMVGQRLGRASIAIKMPVEEAPKQQKPAEKGLIIITGWSMAEPEIYGPTVQASFAVNYSITGTLASQIGSQANGQLDNGFGTGLKRGDEAWIEWAQSVDPANHPRGNARLTIPLRTDPVNLCAVTPPIKPQQDATFTGGGEIDIIADIEALQPEADLEASWLMFEPEIHVSDDSHAVVSSNLDGDYFKPYEQSPGNMSPGYMPDPKGDVSDDVQYRAPGTLYVYIAGRAMRAWYQIHRPKLVSYNGMQVKEVSTEADGCFWRHKSVANLGKSLAIYYAEWCFKYVITDRPVEPIKSPYDRNQLDDPSPG